MKANLAVVSDHVMIYCQPLLIANSLYTGGAAYGGAPGGSYGGQQPGFGAPQPGSFGAGQQSPYGGGAGGSFPGQQQSN